jgi:hypothetical protein
LASAPIRFGAGQDVSGGGVLLAMPALLARQRLCQRATVDYWINAMDGQPFYYVNQLVDHSLVAALREDLTPWLEAN